MDFKIAVLPGDGIGPEIALWGVNVMKAVCEKFGHKVSFTYAPVGAVAIEACGDPFPPETLKVCEEADAVLFSAVGDPKYDNDPTAKVRPEQGLLAMRKQLGLFANIRPVETFRCLLDKSPLISIRPIKISRSLGISSLSTSSSSPSSTLPTSGPGATPAAMTSRPSTARSFNVRHCR